MTTNSKIKHLQQEVQQIKKSKSLKVNSLGI